MVTECSSTKITASCIPTRYDFYNVLNTMLTAMYKNADLILVSLLYFQGSVPVGCVKGQSYR